ERTMAHESGPYGFLAVDQLSSRPGVPALRRALSGRPAAARAQLLDQYLAMAFAQLTYRESLRDIEACLGSLQGKLYHLGFHGKVARSTLADANESRDWRIFADFAQYLIEVARPLHAEDPIGFELDHALYALDSTTIDLC